MVGVVVRSGLAAGVVEVVCIRPSTDDGMGLVR